jgi:hypothetical protein
MDNARIRERRKRIAHSFSFLGFGQLLLHAVSRVSYKQQQGAKSQTFRQKMRTIDCCMQKRRRIDWNEPIIYLYFADGLLFSLQSTGSGKKAYPTFVWRRRSHRSDSDRHVRLLGLPWTVCLI